MAINCWTVQDGLSGGYVPNSIEYFTNKRDAQQYAAYRARMARDDGYKVIGSAYSDMAYEYKHADQDYYPYCIVIDSVQFATCAERDQFIAENSDF